MWVKLNNDEVLKSHPHLSEFLPFLDALNAESARGSVLIATSYIDNLLHETVKAFLIDGKSREQLMSGFNAPLGSLSAKIAIASSLGLINEIERRDCDLIRRIRNKFAHEVHPSFEDDAVANLCRELELSAKPYGDLKFDARGAYVTSTISIVTRLHNRAIYAGRNALKLREWPQ